MRSLDMKTVDNTTLNEKTIVGHVRSSHDTFGMTLLIIFVLELTAFIIIYNMKGGL